MSPAETNAGQHSECPGERTLRRFGDLNGNGTSEATLSPENPSAAVMEHVEGCDRCQRRLEAIAIEDRSRLEELLGSTERTSGLVSASAEPDEQILRGFRILRWLGRGGQSNVYLAEELPTCRCIALKLIAVRREDSGPQREQWLTEVRAAASIEHQNVVRLYRVEETPDHFLLVFEYISGGTLRDWLTKPVSQIQIARVVEVLARTVHQIHQRGILHLDLKPSNILMETNSGSTWELAIPKIADFGVSSRRARPDAREQSPRWVRGTPSYMAPEQILGDEGLLTSATDVYGLGAVLYCMLTARPPLTFEPGADSLEQLLTSTIVAPSDVDPAIDPGLSMIAMKCLRRPAKERFQTAIELSESLNEWIRQQVDPPQKNSRWARTWLLAGSAAAVLGVLSVSSGWPAKSIVPSAVSSQESTKAPDSDLQIRFADEFARLSASDAESVTDVDETFLLQRLSERSPASTVEQAAQLVVDSSRYTDQLLSQSGIPSDQCLRVATLQYASGGRFQNGGRDELYTAATYLLSDSRRLLQFVRRKHPEDQLVLEKLIAVEAGLATVRVERGRNTPEQVQEHYRRNLATLLPVVNLVNELIDQRQRVYWSGFILDAFRLHYWECRFIGDRETADLFREWERTAWEAFQPDQFTSDLSVRHVLMHPDPGALAAADNSVNWIHAESRTVLRREFLFLRLAQPVFSQVNLSDPEITTGKSPEFGATQEGTGWTALLLRISQEIRAINFEGLTLPVLLHEDIVRPLTMLCTQYRAAGQIDEAERLQRRFLELCEAANKLFPDNTDIHLALSEAHLQTWKNEIRRDRPDRAIEALQRSLEAAEAAVAASPGTPRARDQVADRIQRITRFEGSRAQ